MGSICYKLAKKEGISAQNAQFHAFLARMQIFVPFLSKSNIQKEGFWAIVESQLLWTDQKEGISAQDAQFHTFWARMQKFVPFLSIKNIQQKAFEQ